MKKIVYSIFVIILACLSSCKSNVDNLKEDKSTEYVRVIKFMGTITTQPYGINEKTFWSFKDEHAFLNIRKNDFIDRVKILKDKSSDEFKEYNYAFLVKNGKQTDTLYSDNTLKTWILKRKIMRCIFMIKMEKLQKILGIHILFFRDCW